MKRMLCYLYSNVRNMFKVNNKSTRRCSGVFIVNFEYIWYIFLVFFAGFECKWQMEYRLSVYPCVFLELGQEMDQKWAKHMVFWIYWKILSLIFTEFAL